MDAQLLSLRPGERVDCRWSGLVADPTPGLDGELEGGEVISLKDFTVRVIVFRAADGEVLLRFETSDGVQLRGATVDHCLSPVARQAMPPAHDCIPSSN